MRRVAAAAAAAAAGAVAVTVLAPGAHADLEIAHVDTFLAGAKSIEFVRIERVGSVELEGTVTESVRGRAAGARASVPAWLAPGAVVGSEVLLACADLCVGGVVEHDVVPLTARGRKAFAIYPGIVERASVRVLAAGGSAPDLCVTAEVRFADDPAARATVRGTFRASDGSGTAGGAVLGPAPVPAVLFVGNGGTSAGVERLTQIEIHAPAYEVVLVGGRPEAAVGGCHPLAVWPVRPLARTPRVLARAVAGASKKVVLARGKLRVGKVTHPLVVEWTEDDGVLFRSKHFADPSPWPYLTPKGLGFETRRPETWLLLLPEGLEGARAGLSLSELEVVVTRLLPAGARVTWPVRLRVGTDDGEVVGEATLAHVPDPP
jgi:hypothetical protein